MTQALLPFISAQLPTLLLRIWQQIYLAGVATVCAIAMGVPAGIWIARHERFRSIVLGSASILQTIPSLALLAFLLPFMGIGVKPAIIALTVYALLPIVRNTTTGINAVAPDLIEAANGLGFTPRQKLWMVELPLALPIIVAGIRTATSMSIGIATLAAFIGAGGLGDYIYQGLTLNNPRLVLMGAIPAALLALVVDTLIGRLEKKLNKRKKPHHKAITRKRIVVGGVMALLIATVPLYAWQHDRRNTVVIGSKSFSEQFILANMMADMIRAKTHLQVRLKLNLGGTLVCQQALLSGDIDMYPEYTGTAYLVILHKQHFRNPQQVYDDVKKTYQQRFKLHWLAPFGFANNQALAVRQAFATRHHLKTISDLVPLEKDLSIAVPAGFLKRPDGYPGLQQRYHLHFAKVHLMDMGLMYKALANHAVNAIVAATTDGRIAEYHLVLLRDNKHLFPPYQAAPIIRDATLRTHPNIRQALKPLLGVLTNKIMQQLNHQVDVEHQSPTTVAHNFLVAKGLITTQSKKTHETNTHINH